MQWTRIVTRTGIDCKLRAVTLKMDAAVEKAEHTCARHRIRKDDESELPKLIRKKSTAVQGTFRVHPGAVMSHDSLATCNHSAHKRYSYLGMASEISFNKWNYLRWDAIARPDSVLRG